MSINDGIYDIILVGHLSCTAVQHVTIKGYILALGVAHGQCKPSFYSNLFLPTCVPAIYFIYHINYTFLTLFWTAILPTLHR